MLRTDVYRESGRRVYWFRLLLYTVLILILQQATAGRLFSQTVHDAAAHTRYSVGGNNTPQPVRSDLDLWSAILHPRTAFGLTLDVLSAALASAALVMLAAAGIIALRIRHAASDLFSLEEMRRSYLDSSLGGAIGSFGLGAAVSLSSYGVEIGVLVALFALVLFGVSRGGIPACIESAKLEQLSKQLEEMDREITLLGQSEGLPKGHGQIS